MSSYSSIHTHHDPASGLQALIAVHDTRLGPALGGCRFVPYPSWDAMQCDAQRLAEGMTLKSALAGVALGGGKAVICEPEGAYHRQDLLRGFAELVNRLEGLYITAVDSGTTQQDMDYLRQYTPYVTCYTPDFGMRYGDPSKLTAQGVWYGLQAAVELIWGPRSWSSLKIAVQGLGHVGWSLAEVLSAKGTELWVTDTRPERVSRAVSSFGARPLPLDGFESAPVDVLVPCALGGGFDAMSVHHVQARLIAGGANNQLAALEDGDVLHARGITYVPDMVINAGGVIHAEAQYQAQKAQSVDLAKHLEAAALQRITQIGLTVKNVLQASQQYHTPPARVALAQAQKRLVTAVAGEVVS